MQVHSCTCRCVRPCVDNYVDFDFDFVLFCVTGRVKYERKRNVSMNLNQKDIICWGIVTVFLPPLLSGDDECVGAVDCVQFYVVCLSSWCVGPGNKRSEASDFGLSLFWESSNEEWHKM